MHLLEGQLTFVILHLILHLQSQFLEFLCLLFALLGALAARIHLTQIGAGIHVPEFASFVRKRECLLHVLDDDTIPR